MKLVVTLDELAKARHYVSDGNKWLAHQRKILDDLERNGSDTLDAILFLEQLEEMQEQYVAHRDRLEQQILQMLKMVSPERA
jgi:hypothetical protein